MLNACEKAEQPKLSSLGLMGMQNGKATFENNLVVYYKLGIDLQHESTLKDILSELKTKAYMQIFIVHVYTFF